MSESNLNVNITIASVEMLDRFIEVMPQLYSYDDVEIKPTVEVSTTRTTETGPVPDDVVTTGEPSEDTAPPPPAGVELDVNDMPWDARIHAKTKSKNQDGTWRYKQGVDRENYVPEIEAELKKTMGAPKSPAESLFAASDAENENTAPPPPADDDTAPPPPVESEQSAPTFAELLPKIAATTAAKTITSEQIGEALESLGLSALPELGKRPDLIPSFCLVLGIEL